MINKTRTFFTGINGLNDCFDKRYTQTKKHDFASVCKIKYLI